jgi:hypothetical protein
MNKKYINEIYMSIFKVIGYTFLFIIFSPGLIFTFWAGDKGYIMSEQTNYLSMFIHLIIFSTVVVALEEKKLLDQGINSELTEITTRNIPPVVAILLFFLLTPGLIFTIPPESSLLFSKETSVIAVLLHSLLFILLFVVLSRFVNKNRAYFAT